MIDFISMVLGAVLILIVPILLVTLTIIALMRTARIGELSHRLDRLEHAFLRLRQSAREARPAKEEPSAVLPIRPVRELAPRPQPVDAAHVESWIGRRALGWVAVGLLLFAVAFFLKHAFENDWIGPQGRIAIGVTVGLALCVAGLGFHWRGWRRYSQMLSGGGVAVLYLTTYAGFGYYHMLEREWAACFLILIIAQSAALAVLYDAPAIAVMGIIGGLLNPILLATDVDQYPAFFSYLALLCAGAVGLTSLRAWPAIATLAFVGTQGLFWGWYVQHYEPEKLGPAVLFQCVLFGLFLAHSFAAHLLRKQPATAEDLARLLGNAFFGIFTLWWLLDADYHAWMGSLALGLALLYCGLSWLIASRRPDDHRLAFTGMAAAVALVAAIFPLQIEAGWITLGWAVEGAALWWFGLRGRIAALRYFGVALLALASCRLVLVDTPFAHAEPFIPLVNQYGLPALAVAGCVLFSALIARQFLATFGDFERVARWSAALGGVALLGLVLSTETYGYFVVQIDDATQGNEAQHLRQLAQTSLSVVWAAYAALVMAAGFLLKNIPLRALALGLLAVTFLKIVAVDMSHLPGLYRVAAFLALALVMGVAAWWYQKLQPYAHVPEEGKVTAHAA